LFFLFWRISLLSFSNSSSFIFSFLYLSVISNHSFKIFKKSSYDLWTATDAIFYFVFQDNFLKENKNLLKIMTHSFGDPYAHATVCRYESEISNQSYKGAKLAKEEFLVLIYLNLMKCEHLRHSDIDFLHNKILWGMSKFIVFYKESEEYIDNNDIKDTISNVLFLLKNEQYKEAIIEIDKIENSENILVDIKNHINSRILANELLNSINFDSVKELVKDVK
jgi:hypothetical protein